MKTSNKLLLGLFVCIILSITVFNITLKNRMDKNPQFIKTEMKSQTGNQNGVKININTNESDSIALDSAIGNE